MSSEQSLKSVREAAAFLKCSPSYLNKLRLTGGGPVFAKLGAKVVYDQGDLSAWVAARKKVSTSDTTGNGAGVA